MSVFMEAAGLVFGAGVLALLSSIHYRLGGVTNALQDHSRRLGVIETKIETKLEAN